MMDMINRKRIDKKLSEAEKIIDQSTDINKVTAKNIAEVLKLIFGKKVHYIIGASLVKTEKLNSTLLQRRWLRIKQ